MKDEEEVVRISEWLVGKLLAAAAGGGGGPPPPSRAESTSSQAEPVEGRGRAAQGAAARVTLQ